MESKKWYKSKAVWSGVVAILIAGYSTATVSFGLPVIPDFVYGILGALGVYSRVTAVHTIEK